MGSNISSQDQELDYEKVNDWDVSQVCQWVILLGKEDASVSSFNVQVIIRNDITGQKLLDIEDKDLETYGIAKQSHREKILAAIEELRKLNTIRAVQ